MLNTRDYTIIYTSSPAKDLDQVDPHTPKDDDEEDKFYSGASAELRKRRVDEDDDDNRGNSTRSLGLFSKYQFMNYGVFYGLMALFFLFAILSFALSAITNIKVSYGGSCSKLSFY